MFAGDERFHRTRALHGAPLISDILDAFILDQSDALKYQPSGLAVLQEREGKNQNTTNRILV